MICRIKEAMSISIVLKTIPFYGQLTQPGRRYGIYVNLLIAGLKVAWPVCCRFFWGKTFISMSSCDLMHALDNTGLHSFATGNWALGEIQNLLKVLFLFCFCFYFSGLQTIVSLNFLKLNVRHNIQSWHKTCIRNVGIRNSGTMLSVASGWPKAEHWAMKDRGKQRWIKKAGEYDLEWKRVNETRKLGRQFLKF